MKPRSLFVGLALFIALALPVNAQFLAAAQTLQQRIDNAYAGKGRVQLPYGENVITSSILTSNKAGLVVQGHGNTWGINPAHPNMGAHSTVQWGSVDSSQPMVIVRGANTVWRDLNLQGDAWTASGGGSLNLYASRPTAGFLVRSVAGVGSGKHLFDNVNVEKCVTAWQAGEAEGDDNCDVTTVRHARARNCYSQHLNLNSQGMGWVYEHCIYGDYTDGKVFDYVAGGDLVARYQLVTSRATLLNLRPGSASAIGSNNGGFSFYDLKTDTLARGTTLVEVTGRQTKCNVNFWGGNISGNGFNYNTLSRRMLNLRGGPRVLLSGVWIVIGCDDSIIWDTDADSYTASVVLSGCRISATSIAAMFDEAASQGTIKVICMACVNGNGDYFYDPNNPNAVAEGDVNFVLTINGTL